MEALIQLAIISIEIDPTLQPRINGLDPEHVESLQAVAENWPPLVVVKCDDRYVLVDGFHRFAAAQNLGLGTVTVKVVDSPADGDLHALAFALNAVHGRPLSLSDRRAFAVRLLRQHPELSDREIGRRCGLTQPPIAKLREELEHKAEIAPTDTRIGGDGQLYKVTVNKPQRTPGSLPAPALGSMLQGAVDALVTPQERREQRRLVQYLERLAVALEDQLEFEKWETSHDAAEACRLVLGAEKAIELAKRLGDYSANVLDVAHALGYVESPVSAQ